ncbi:hypothetical protein [Nocardia veterana]|uniref:Uncharacterized protein n=1 Tax=Nocardia veterana TaxID=132249 RepID=A0A7X6LXG1_9NOCA|nr:hypothetical protein [Nocardia veterana]NKY85814.1 hypothetical protein [Nocardia veterana]
MALGKEAAAELSQAVAEGRFRLTPEAAREVAGHYEWFAGEMAERQREVQELQRLDGFGGFESAKRLQQGFENKAVQGFEAYKAAEESAYRMAEAIYKSAGLIDAAEASNTAAIKAANRRTSDAKA